MAYVSDALGYQPAPTIPERRCASCGVLACQTDGTPWRNSIRLIAGERRTVCESCGERAASHAKIIAICDDVLAKPGVVAALRYLEER